MKRTDTHVLQALVDPSRPLHRLPNTAIVIDYYLILIEKKNESVISFFFTIRHPTSRPGRVQQCAVTEHRVYYLH